jgi:antitoxin ParD1/3/4
MNVSLPAEIEKQIQDRVRSGKYRSAEDVVAAAISMLDQQERFGDFGPGELDKLLAEGERDIARGDVIDSGKAFEELRRMSTEQRGINQ